MCFPSLHLLQDNLEDEDTYIYLQCIHGLVEVANYSPDVVINLLTKEFAHVEDRKYVDDKQGERAVELK